MRKRLKTVERHPEIEINAKRFRLHGDKDYQRNTITLTVLGKSRLKKELPAVIYAINNNIFK